MGSDWPVEPQTGASGAGYRELDHTADWALQVWAPDLAALISTAMEGMAALMGIQPGPASEVRTLQISAPDQETLLVDALTEVLLANETERILLEPVEVHVEDLQLSARCRILPVVVQEKEIKAVTYHALEIRTTEWGLETVIVFDV